MIPQEKSNLQPGSTTNDLNYNHDLLARYAYLHNCDSNISGVDTIFLKYI